MYMCSNLAQTLSARFKEVIFDGTWVANTNYYNELHKLDWQTATQKIADCNTIALLAQHIHYYVKGVGYAFEQGRLTISDKYSFDFAPITNQAAWETFLQRFWEDAAQLAEHFSQLEQKQLLQTFIQEEYGSYLRNIEGMIEHCYYHLGQIVLLKKMINSI
jgi:hypothetical protein